MAGSTTISGFTAQVAIELAAIAYDKGNEAITAQLAALPASLGGPWSLAWLGVDAGNQMYVTHSASAGLAVAIRGSVTDPFSLAFWLDWFRQDLNALGQKPWVYGRLPAGSMISRGTVDGIQSLQSLNDNGLSLVQELARWRTSSPIPVIGHSLGGGLASAFAPWLEQALSELQGQPARCIPVTFAAPAIGNETFADALEQYYESASNRYHNTQDVVPHAWAGLEWIQNSFVGGPGIPEVLKLAVEAERGLLHLNGLRYRQPGTDQALQGTLVQNVSWVSEVGTQHATATYRSLLSGG